MEFRAVVEEKTFGGLDRTALESMEWHADLGTVVHQPPGSEDPDHYHGWSICPGVMARSFFDLEAIVFLIIVPEEDHS